MAKTRIGVLLVVMMPLLLVSAAQPKKKNAAKVEYDKFKDVTCATVNLGDIVPFRQVFSKDPVFLDAFYCSRGQELDKPTQIQMRLRSKDTAWLTAMRTPTMNIIFLLDSDERLSLAGKYEYTVDKKLGGVSQVTIEVTTDELLQITDAKVAEFQVGEYTYKLKQNDLAKLRNLTEVQTTPRR